MRTICARAHMRRRSPDRARGPPLHTRTHTRRRSDLKPAATVAAVYNSNNNTYVRTICGTWYSVRFKWIGMCPVIVPGGFVYNNYTFFSLFLTHARAHIQKHTHTPILLYFLFYTLLLCAHMINNIIFYYMCRRASFAISKRKREERIVKKGGRRTSKPLSPLLFFKYASYLVGINFGKKSNPKNKVYLYTVG